MSEELVNEWIPELGKYRETLAQLTPYATEYRYPGKVADQEDAKTCVNIIRKFRDNMRLLLNV